MTYSKLASQIIPTKNYSSRYGEKVWNITVHHCAGCVGYSPEQIINGVMTPRQGSANYVITTDGKIIGSVDEKYRAWTTGGIWDRNSITMEVANSAVGDPWPISNESMRACIELCADICKRYGIKKLYYDGKNGTLRRHCDWANTACPGPYVKSKTDYICREVNKLLEKEGPEPEGKMYHIYSGSFLSSRNSEKWADQIRSRGFEAVVKKIGIYHKVQVGVFSSKEGAEEYEKRLNNEGFATVISEE